MRYRKVTPFLKIGNKKLEYYENILIHADIGLHDQVFDSISKKLEAGSRILDVGAGEGAFSLRLKRNGYEIEATDIDPSVFKPKDEIKCLKVDLNNEDDQLKYLVNRKNYYDSVVGMEVIEHLQNPWLFISFCFNLLKPKGYLMITTPNITSFLSRIIFLKSGEFHQFSKGDEAYGHINPLNSKELEMIFSNCNLKIIEKKAGGLLPIIWITNGGLRYNIIKLLGAIFYPFMKSDKQGWCLIYLLQKII